MLNAYHTGGELIIDPETGKKSNVPVNFNKGSPTSMKNYALNYKNKVIEDIADKGEKS